MFQYLQSYIKSVQYIISLVKFNEDKVNQINFTDENYLGLDKKNTIVRVFYAKRRKKSQSIIIFPGASPYAEEHPGMIMLGSALRNAGYNVFLPRIPNLKNLLIVKENVDWFAHCYEELLKHKTINGNAMVVGLSYGGANLLRASMDSRMQLYPPKSILSYGTYYSINTSLDFFISGKIKYKNKIYNIKPHEWGTIVIFYNFFQTINTRYNSEKITSLLKYRIEDKHNQVDTILNRFDKKHQSLINKILNGQVDEEIKVLIQKMLDKNNELLDYLSPSQWAKDINNKVFIIHGANDSMVPFTESTLLSKNIPNNKILISFLYEHREISTNRGALFKIKELTKMIKFFAYYFRYNL